jgi:hypothetical protein
MLKKPHVAVMELRFSEFATDLIEPVDGGVVMDN